MKKGTMAKTLKLRKVPYGGMVVMKKEGHPAGHRKLGRWTMSRRNTRSPQQ